MALNDNQRQLIQRITAEYSSESLDAAKAIHQRAAERRVAAIEALHLAEIVMEEAELALLGECQDIAGEEAQ